MRDKLKTQDYFQDYITRRIKHLEEDIEWLNTGKVVPGQVAIFKRASADARINLIEAKYSAGYAPEDLVENYIDAVEWMYDTWDKDAWKYGDREEQYEHYVLSAYDEMLWMLSIGYLINAPIESFQKLVVILDRAEVRDLLFEFIIAAKLPDRQPIIEESYRKYFDIPRIFAKLRAATGEPDKTLAAQLVKEFLENDWYQGHKDASWYNSHTRKHNTYTGYWSFESAAVVKIRGLDDSSFIDNQYYPKDLVHTNE